MSLTVSGLRREMDAVCGDRTEDARRVRVATDSRLVVEPNPASSRTAAVGAATLRSGGRPTLDAVSTGPRSWNVSDTSALVCANEASDPVSASAKRKARGRQTNVRINTIQYAPPPRGIQLGRSQGATKSLRRRRYTFARPSADPR